MTRSPLRTAIDRLAKFYGRPPKPFPVDPFEQILWVNVAYLADDTGRLAAFRMLKRVTGLKPERILHATDTQLRAATRYGILPAQSIVKLRECAATVLDRFDGDLDAMIRLPTASAVRALRKFPGIGEPGAEKILLFSGRAPLLAPDSNALRVLQRLGIAPKGKRYATDYAAARLAATGGLGRSVSLMQRAHHLLRQHGQELCKAKRPACDQCPLVTNCPRIGVSA